MKNILVTGTEGFIGSRFVELNGDKYNIIKFSKEAAKESIEKNTFDFWLRNINGVVCFGAETKTTSTNIQENFFYNVLFIHKLVDECEFRNIPLIFSSSASLYGNGNDIPLNLYAWTKLVGEKYGTAKQKSSPSAQWTFTALRYFNVYGIGEHNKDLEMTSLVFQNLGKHEINLFEGKPLRDFIFVDDVVRANEHALKTKQNGVFDVGSFCPRPFEDIAACLGARIKYIKNPIKSQYQSFTCANKDKALIGWKPEYSLEDGIKKTRKYYNK
jgi:UDP-glucose 4-epimerase